MIELLAVIAIILILATLVMPLSGRLVERGHDTRCLSNLRQWASYWAFYISDHKGRFMNGWEYKGKRIGYHRGIWALELQEYYVEQSQLVFCPKATKPTVVNGAVLDRGGVFTTYKEGDGNEWANRVVDRASYGINCWVYDPPPAVAGIQNREAAKHWRGWGGAGRPHEIPVFLDSMWRGAGPDHDQYSKYEPPAFNGAWKGTEAEMHHVAMDRHHGGVQAVFMDMSAFHIGIKKLWVLRWHNAYDPKVAYQVSWPAWMKDYPEYKP